jgi:transposase
MDNGYSVHLANPSAIKQYEGLKHSDDAREASRLARLLTLGILPEGSVYPKEERPERDLLRKRLHLVSHRTSHILSFKNLVSRNRGIRMSSNEIKGLREENIEGILQRSAVLKYRSARSGSIVTTLFRPLST